MGTITTFPPAPLGYAPSNTVAYAQVTTALSGFTLSGDTPYPGLSVNVVVSEGRRLKITTYVCMSASATGYLQAGIQQDGVLLERSYFNNVTAGQIVTHCFSAIVTPSAGLHTYRTIVNAGSGTVTTYAVTYAPDWILVEDITGQPGPVASASVPVGQLGYAEFTGATQTIGATATETDLTNLSVNVTVPAGRTIRVTGFVHARSSVATDTLYLRIREDGSNNRGFAYINELATNPNTSAIQAVFSPTAGAHTYKITVTRATGTGSVTMYGAAGEPSWIMVEDITPTPASANSAPSSTLAYVENGGHGTTVTTDPTDIPGMAVTFTVPAGRRILIKAKQHISTNVVGDRVTLKVTEGSTVLNAVFMTLGMAGNGEDLFLSHVLTPSAGAHTYKLQAGRSAGTGVITTYTQPGVTSNYLLVEDVTGVGVSGHTHPQIDDTGWIAPTLTNGWLNYDTTAYSAAAYRKIGSVVYLRGLVKSGTVGAGTGAYIFQLPVGFRPPKNLQLICATNATQTASQAAYIELLTDGGVRASVGSNVWWSLELLYFFVD